MSLIATSAGREIQLAQLNVSECEDVTNYGADPTGVADSTTAFDDARIAAGNGGAVCVPVGTYLVDPDAFDWGGRLWIGERAHATVFSEIQARIDGTSLCGATAPLQLANLVFTSGGNTVTNAIFIDGADDSVLFNTNGNGCTNGIRVASAVRVTLISCGASGNSIGHLYEEAELRGYHITGNTNTTRGIDIVGTGDDTDDQFVGLYGVSASTNTGAEQLRVSGARAGELVGLYSEGGGDGLLVTGGTRNFNFGALRFTGGGAPTVAIRVVDSSQNTFVQVGASGAPSSEYARARVEGTSELNEFYAMHFGSGVTSTPMTIEFYDGVGSYECIADNGVNFKGDTAPTRGNWIQGQMVFNNSPTAASTLLWRCLVSGAPGTWEAVS